MWTQLKALLNRYYITYLRFPKRIISDFLLAGIIGGALALSQLEILGVLAVIVYFLTLPFTFLTTVRTMIGEIVSEKNTGIKEYLKLNGLSIYTYQLYLFSITSIKTVFFTVFIVVGIVIGGIIENFSQNSILPISISTGETVLVYILCAFATISFILALSTLFSDPKVASSIGALIYAAISLGSNIVFSSDEPIYYYLVCLFPQSGLTISFFLGLAQSESQQGPPISRGTINLIIFFDFFFYLVLYTYLDQVIKDENGVRKPLLFFLDVFKNKKKPIVSEDSERLLNQDEISYQTFSSNYNQDSSSAVYHEQIAAGQNIKQAVKVRNLSKHFGDFAAVDNISFPIYEGQIFCLLGHNGAGKTTTIRMMTGMLEVDQGEILYDEQSLLENLEEVRKRIGICTQHDILFEKLKVSEHLKLIAKLRHVPDHQVSAAVEEAINKVNLINERDKFSEELSGGNKRKLSLAMAIIGNTRFIFLDEPTSGMDPQNRRIMWYHLKQLKSQGLTILLTTHHLDEADELADRIAIMSRGKLLALGTSEFFKKNFGVGYHLNLMPRYESIRAEEFLALKPKLMSQISTMIPAAKFDEQTAHDVLRCSLPFSTQREFPLLFTELEKSPVIRISVEMNTLEDVFVNIGLHEDQLLQGESLNTNIDLNMHAPSCLSERPVYSFFSQTFALAKRRVYILYRSWRNIFLMVLPLVLILIGVLSSFGFEYAEARFAFFEVITVLAFSLNTGAYCSLPVYEREDKLKYLMDVMGLRVLPYWIGNIIVDFIAITVINVIVFGLYAWLFSDIHPLIANLFATPTEFLAVIIPHGLALVTLAYTWSFIFNSGLSAVKYFPLIYFFVLFLIGSYLVARAENVTDPGNKRPFLGAFVGVICPSILFLEFLAAKAGAMSVAQVVVFEVGYAVFYFLLTLALSSGKINLFTKTSNIQGYTIPEPFTIPIDTNDINIERNRTLQSNQDPIKVMNLTKTYDNAYTAVRDVTFGVEPGQIFGLLGPNGAGKSTTFNVLTAAIPKSEGSVQLLNHEIRPNMPEVYEKVGICPQFNALWSNLTVKEHLILFGNLKGLKGPHLTAVIEYYLDALHLREYANKQAGQLSGGNKRKLSVANAFIGSAYLLFLDEPSTGVDPLAKRFLWHAIQQVLRLRKASVVLTTHSMYEAESLSHKIGILINGRFVCIGPTQYLKDKYSQGYKITVSLIPNSPDPMSKIMEVFPQAIRIQDASFVQQTYHLPFQGFLFSEAFSKLEALKEGNIIKDFSIYNTTLEQIFIYFSRFQISLDNI